MIVAAILGPIEDVLTWLLEEMHTALSLPWAWAIVGVTLLVRMLLVPLTVRQIHSMQRMQRHMPQMKEIQRKYKGDRPRMNEELMRFYRENQINPAASCLPMLLQIPIFFALYFVLRDFDDEVFPKYPASDLGWLGFVPDITNGITAHWTGFLLVTIYVISQVSSIFFTPTTLSRSQRWLMMALPIVFVFFIIDPPGSTVFPVGLLLYWMTTNLWTVGQGIVTRRYAPKLPAAMEAARRTSRSPGSDKAPARADGSAAAEPKTAVAAAPRPPRKVKRKKKARR